jgi:hypothetical protein
MQRLIDATPLPSPSPTLAGLIARALAAGQVGDGRELDMRLAALRRAGRIDEAKALAGTPIGNEFQSRALIYGTATLPADALYFLAHDEKAHPEMRIAGAEQAAARNVIDGKALGEAYREAVPKLDNSAPSGPALRARLFVAFEAAPSAKIRAESIEALLASARDEGIEVPIAQALAQANAELLHDPQAASFAETGVRVAALAGDERSAWAWVDAGGERLRSWQLLLAASEPSSPRAAAALQRGVEIALKGGLSPPLLHRLVTVLDALDYDVPIPLWDEASKTPQPSDGYLPETGALTALKEAADTGEVGRAVLLTAAVLGAKGPQGANLIALGDAIRALKRVGLEAEARRLGFEALYVHWPSQGKA